VPFDPFSDDGAVLRRDLDFPPAPRGQGLTYQQVWTRYRTRERLDEITGGEIVARSANAAMADLSVDRQATIKQTAKTLAANLDEANERYGNGSTGSGSATAQTGLRFRGSADIPALMIGDTENNLDLTMRGLAGVQLAANFHIGNVVNRSLAAPEPPPPPPPQPVVRRGFFGRPRELEG